MSFLYRLFAGRSRFSQNNEVPVSPLIPPVTPPPGRQGSFSRSFSQSFNSYFPTF